MPLRIEEIAAAADPIRSYNTELIISRIPGGGNGDVLRARCREMAIPNSANEMSESTFQGLTVKYAGLVKYDRTLEANFEETGDLRVYTLLNRWKFLQGDPRSGIQRPKFEYATTGEIHLLRNDKTLAGKFKLYGLCIESIGAVATTSEGNDPIRIPVTFSYDFQEPLEGAFSLQALGVSVSVPGL